MDDGFGRCAVQRIGEILLQIRCTWNPQPGLKPKDLVGIAWRVDFALQDDGWYLRRDIIWSKPNPMPESVRDRCTTAYEYLFHLSKSARYYYDIDAINEPFTTEPRWDYPGRARTLGRGGQPSSRVALGHAQRDSSGGYPPTGTGRNKRSVWTVATAPYAAAHFATYPPGLIGPCILAGCPEGGTVLDPFLGAGTTALVADRLGRHCLGIELSPAYAQLARRRLGGPVLAAARVKARGVGGFFESAARCA